MSKFNKAFIKIGSGLSVILICIALILIVFPDLLEEQTAPELTELTDTTRPSVLMFDEPSAFDVESAENGSSAALREPLPVAAPVRDLRFGAVQTYETPNLATVAGVGWTRVFFSWRDVQRNGSNDWNEFYFPDHLLDQELNANRQPVGLLIGTPAWASAGGNPRDVPNGLYLPYDDPNNHWGQFVKGIVQRYQGRIDHWIIWNEPDIWNNDHGTQAWNGSLEDYVQLLKVAYQAAKSVNNRAVIGAAATTYWWDRAHNRELYLTRMLKAIQQDPDAAANNGFFDFVGLNLYYNPDQIYDIIDIYRDELNRYGFANKQVWLTETNAPPSSDPQHPAPAIQFNITLEQQSYFLVQTWAMSIASGASRIESYKMKDGEYSGVLPYGMQRKDGSLRPVFWSYRTLATYLSDFQNATLIKEGDIRRVTVSRGQRGITTVVWNKSVQAQTVNVPATANSALLVDPFGALRTIQPRNGQYTLRLPARPGQGEQVGGRPFLIVEGAGAQVILDRPDQIPNIPPVDNPVISNLPPTPEPQPTAEASPEPSATAEAEASPEPSATAEASPEPSPTAQAYPEPTRLPNVPPGLADWDIPNGHLFTQTANGQGGFRVEDDQQAAFWREFQRLGGIETVGYPISRRYTYDGFVTQAFQKLILQWRPEANQAWPVNVFDELSKANLDQRLLLTRQTPYALQSEQIDPPNATFQEIILKRQALLAYNRAIEAHYFRQSDPLNVFGLPTSQVEDMGNHYVMRTQRAVFQQWKEEVPWAAKGQVTIANGGDIAKELGWLPANILQPEAVGG